MLSLQSILKKFAEERIEQLRGEIDRQGLNDTGRLKRELDFAVQETGEKTVLTITAPAYIVSLDRGAGPIRQVTDGKFVATIKAWAERKLRMDPKESLGFAIAYMKRRAGENPNGNWQTTDSVGNYLVPNPYNEGGLIGKAITDSDFKELIKAIVKVQGEKAKERIRTSLI